MLKTKQGKYLIHTTLGYTCSGENMACSDFNLTIKTECKALKIHVSNNKLTYIMLILCIDGSYSKKILNVLNI